MDLIWVRHPTLVWVAASIVSQDGAVTTVRSVDGEEITTDKPALDICPRNPKHLEGMDDLTSLQHLDEANVLHNVAIRYLDNKIYTYTGPILIAVNPWKRLPLYTLENVMFYMGKSRNEAPPHTFSIADVAYRNMLARNQDQAILVSGESGAGKTETTKFLMQYLAALSGLSHEGVSIERQVLETNPILEAFGNAKTLRNDNSSRFGKFIEIRFDKNGHLVGAAIITYLLEKSRVVRVSENERNYHIFYQLCGAASYVKAHPEEEAQALEIANAKGGAAAVAAENSDSEDDDEDDDEEKKVEEKVEEHPNLSHHHHHHQQTPLALPEDLDLSEVQSYQFTSQGNCTHLHGVNDVDHFRRTLNAMRLVGIPEAEIADVWRCVAGVLKLGQVEVAKSPANEEHSMIDVADSRLVAAADLLGIEPADLCKCLCTRKIKAGVDTVTANNNVTEARNGLEALAKALYGRLFDWLVHKVNKSLKQKASDAHARIYILDIFGFEFFQVNSFEQFCINYANEMLQQQFNTFVFKLEQEEYRREGIPWETVEFLDNAECIELIHGARTGILSMLDEECLVPQGSDAGFVQKIRQSHKSHPYFEAPKRQQDAFCVKHYAGMVTYDSVSFLEKNKDALGNDISAAVTNSKRSLVATLFNPKEQAKESAAAAATTTTTNKTRSRKATTSSLVFESVGSQFKTQLSQLMATIAKTHPHYVRCVNPNGTKTAGTIDNQRIVQQLRCGGVIEAVRVTRAGFPSRYTFPDFVARFKIIAIDQVHGDDAKEDTRRILESMALAEGTFHLGHAKAFFKLEQLDALEKQRAKNLGVYVVIFQRMARGYLQRKKYEMEKLSVTRLQASSRKAIKRYLFVEQRRNLKAQTIQLHCRRSNARERYSNLLWYTICIERIGRGFLARRLYSSLRRNKGAVDLQCHIRQQMARTKFVALRRASVVFQTYLRGLRARRERKRLRIEAKQVGNLQAQKVALEQRVKELEAQLTQERELRSNNSIYDATSSPPQVVAVRPTLAAPVTPIQSPVVASTASEMLVSTPSATALQSELSAMQRKLAAEAIERGKLKEANAIMEKSLNELKTRLALEQEKREQMQRANTLLKKQVDEARQSSNGTSSSSSSRRPDDAVRAELVKAQVELQRFKEKFEQNEERMSQLEDKERAMEEMLSKITQQLIEEREAKQNHMEAEKSLEESVDLLREDIEKKKIIIQDYLLREQLTELATKEPDWQPVFEAPKKGLRDFFTFSREKKPTPEQCLRTLQTVLEEKMLEIIRLRNELLNKGMDAPAHPLKPAAAAPKLSE